MEITIEELMDYIQCSMLAKYRYKDEVDTTYTGLAGGMRTKLNEYGLEESYDREIHRLVFHIFNVVQDGQYPSLYTLRRKWGHLWSKEKTVEDVLQNSSVRKDKQSIMNRLEKRGLNAIETLHARFKENTGFPLLVGNRVKIKIGKHTVYTTIDLVREVVIEDKPLIELMDVVPGIKQKKHAYIKPMRIHIHNDLQVTAANLALKQLTGKEADRIVYYDIDNDEEFETNRDEEDYRTLENILNHVEKAMDAGVYYPVMNNRCYDCPYQYECRKRNWY